jgi:RNA polymerase sigma-70 factor (ECF subfamily)
MNDYIKKPHSSAGEDHSLVAAFQAKQSKEVFDWLVIKYQHKVFNICYRFMGNYHDANDCAQDTFIKVYRSLKNFKFKSEFSTWLYRIAVNTCKSKLTSLPYRFNKVIGRLGARDGDDEDETRSPEAELERSEKAEAIQKAIDSLAEDHKSVVILRDIEGLSYEEIAGATGYNIGTVKSKLSRARFRLQKKLEGLI